MSSDTSDDEDLDKLREATDTQFINDSMFNKTTAAIEDQKVEKLPSLRRSKDEDEQFNLFRVTPQFRGYVAKHLSKMLDETLLKKLSDNKNTESNVKPKRRKTGIKLLHNSPHFIKAETCNKIPVQSVRKIRYLKNTAEEDTNDDKFKSVAVSPDFILSKKDTEFWSTRSKAPIYSYIKTGQGLILK